MKHSSPARALRMQLLELHTKPRKPRTEAPSVRQLRRWMVQSVIDATARMAWRFGLTHLSTGDCRKLARLLHHAKKAN